jgi:hypothetical protein
LSSWQGGPCRPAVSARSVFLRLENAKNREHTYGFARRNPLFSTARQPKRKHPYGLASFRPTENTAFAQYDTLPAFRANLHRLEPGASSDGFLPAQIHANPRRQRYPIETQGVYANPLGASGSVTFRVTHLAEKGLKMRHKISGHRRNPLKKKESTAA